MHRIQLICIVDSLVRSKSPLGHITIANLCEAFDYGSIVIPVERSVDVKSSSTTSVSIYRRVRAPKLGYRSNRARPRIFRTPAIRITIEVAMKSSDFD